MTGAAHQDARRPRLRRRRGQPVEVPGRPVLASAPAPTTSSTRFAEVDGVYTNKPPGGIAYRCSFRVTEAVHAIERMADVLAQELKMDPAELRFKNFIQPEQFPYKSALGWEYDSGNYPAALKKAMEMIGYAELRKEQAEKRAARRADGHRHLELHRDRRRRAVEGLRHPRHQDVRLAPRSASTPPARRSPASAPSRRARGTRRPTPRSSPRSSASRPRTSRSRRATPTPRPTASAPTPAARRRPPGAAGGDGRAQDPRQGARRSPPTCWRSSEDDLEWETGQVLGQGRAAEGARRSRRSPSPPTPTIRRAWRRGSRRSTTTTRRT